jgi:hypothetical protein
MRYTAIFCVTWLVFGKRGDGGYVFAFFSGMMLFVYHFFINVIPDGVPGIGRLDDALINFPGYIVIAICLYIGFSSNKKSKKIAQMIEEGRYDEAIGLLKK